MSDMVQYYLGRTHMILYNVMFSIFDVLMGLAGIMATSKTFFYNFDDFICKIFGMDIKDPEAVNRFTRVFIWFLGIIVFFIVF